MRNSIKFLLALFIMSAVFIGCGKDDDDPIDDVADTSTNYFMYGDVRTDLAQSLVFSFGDEEPGVYGFEVNFLTSGIKIHNVEGDLDSVSGTGDLVYFELYSSSATTLDAGEYTLSEDEVVKTFTEGSVIIGFDASDDDAGNDYSVASGTVTVISHSSTIEVTFDCIDEDGKVLKGYYKGAYTQYDDSKNKGEKKRLF